MNPDRRTALLLLCLFAVLCSAQASGQTAASTLQGKVVAVADGDSVTVLDASNRHQSVRLQGIDSPEIRQEFGEQAKQNLANLVFGRQVVVEYYKHDTYGHILGKVLLLDGRDVNLEQLKDGMAWHYKEFEADQLKADRKIYARAEREAREARRGLWADVVQQPPTPPWVWRRIERRRERPPILAFGKIIGNARTKIYHRPDCPNYNKVGAENKVEFETVDDAERAGYRAAKNCP